MESLAYSNRTRKRFGACKVARESRENSRKSLAHFASVVQARLVICLCDFGIAFRVLGDAGGRPHPP